MSIIDNQFNIINDKLQQLLKLQIQLKKENEKLKMELEQAKSKEQAAQNLVQELQQQTSVLKLAAGEFNQKDKKDFEKQINQYIREIDKCISFLSQ
jgi:viroplasmin and RNaseH domain-containing protein